MVPEFVFYPAAASGTGPCPAGGSKWNRALPGRRQQVAVGPADLGCVTFQGDLVKVVCRERKVWYNVT